MDYTDESSEESVSSCDIFDDFITLGKRSEYKSIQWKFPQTSKCPLETCRISCSSRNVALIHFRYTHAKSTLICTICDSLFSIEDFEKHYAAYHPNKVLPNAPSLPDNSGENRHHDLITLGGLGIVTQWRFPYINRCPVNSCRKIFADRSKAISHYKQIHARYSILCSVCNKPLVSRKPSQFERHYLQVHPRKTIPIDLRINMESKLNKKAIKRNNRRKISTETESELESEPENEPVDDLITLNGFGRITQWRFPQHITNCPVINCGLLFATRTIAIDHYKTKHADKFILCSVCVKPISAGSLSKFIEHYRSIHPGSDIPFGLEKDRNCAQKKLLEPSKTIPTRAENVDSSSNMSEHLNENYTSKRILCPLKICNHQSERIEILYEHWNKEHANLRFPEMRNDSEYTYKTTKLTPQIQEQVYYVSSEESSTDTSKLECSQCDYIPGTFFALKRHRIDKHKCKVFRSENNSTWNSQSPDDEDSTTKSFGSHDDVSIANDDMIQSIIDDRNNENDKRTKMLSSIRVLDSDEEDLTNTKPISHLE